MSIGCIHKGMIRLHGGASLAFFSIGTAAFNYAKSIIAGILFRARRKKAIVKGMMEAPIPFLKAFSVNNSWVIAFQLHIQLLAHPGYPIRGAGASRAEFIIRYNLQDIQQRNAAILSYIIVVLFSRVISRDVDRVNSRVKVNIINMPIAFKPENIFF